MKEHYTVSKCPCEHRACQDWHVQWVAAVQGVGFTEEQAYAVADLLNKMEDEKEAIELSSRSLEMKWHVKIWLSPIVQEEPEEFDLIDLDYLSREVYKRRLYGAPKVLGSIREIRITKAPDAPQE